MAKQTEQLATVQQLEKQIEELKRASDSVAALDTKRTGNLAEFFAASPLRGSGLKVKRIKDRPLKVAVSFLRLITLSPMPGARS